MSGDGGGQALPSEGAAGLRGLSFGGRVGGPLADPITQGTVLILAVSLVFGAFPGLDIWFSGLFAEHHAGFPLRSIAAFEAVAQLSAWSVPLIVLALLVAVGWKLTHPERPTPVSPSALMFLGVSLAAVSVLTPVLLMAAGAGRVTPVLAEPFGGPEPFVALWGGGGACTTDCAAFSSATAWAVWLVAAAAVTPLAWRSAAIASAGVLAVAFALEAIARGEDYLSGVLLSAAFSTLLVAVVHRVVIERPGERLSEKRLEAALTRVGQSLSQARRDTDWTRVRAKAQSPWRDRAGRLSPLKAVTFALTLVPGLWFVWLTLNGELTPLPWVFIIYNSGIWALWFFLATLAVTPARHIFGWRDLISVRRMLGIAGLAYTVFHVADYLWLDRFSIGFIVNEYLTRPTIWVATVSTVGIVILGATSLDESIRRMGTAAWTRLHTLAYPAIGLGILHFAMSPGSYSGPPFLMSGMFAWLMAWRVLNRYGLGTRPLILAALGVATALLAFAFEIVWLALYQGIPAGKTVGFTFQIVDGLPSTWQLLAIGLTVAALAALFGRHSAWRQPLRFRPPGEPLTQAAWAALKAIGRTLQLPLRDRSGEISPLKAAVFALLFMPGLWFVGLAPTGGLTRSPFGFLIYNTGVWATWFLLLSLAVTPARHILHWPGLIVVRRMVGLAGLAYTLLHVVIYFLLDRTSWTLIVADLRRATIIIAIASTLGLLALGVTSTDAAIRRLGAIAWNRVHYLAYPAVGFAILHFDMGPESLGGTPFVITGVYFWVMGWRLLHWFGHGRRPLALLALTLAATALSFAFEAAWIRYVRGVTDNGTLDQLWDAGLGLAATWQVLLVGLAATALGAVFNGTPRATPLRLNVAAPAVPQAA